MNFIKMISKKKYDGHYVAMYQIYRRRWGIKWRDLVILCLIKETVVDGEIRQVIESSKTFKSRRKAMRWWKSFPGADWQKTIYFEQLRNLYNSVVIDEYF
jgi:hypothetical protein